MDMSFLGLALAQSALPPPTHTPTTHMHVHRPSHACDPSSLRTRGTCSLPPSSAYALSDQGTGPQTLHAHEDFPGDGHALTSGGAPSGWPRRPVSGCWSLGRREGTGPYPHPWGRKLESPANTPNNPPRLRGLVPREPWERCHKKKMKRQAKRRYCIACNDDGLVFRIHKDHLHINKRNQATQQKRQ